MWAECWRDLLVITVLTFWGDYCVLYGHATDPMKVIKKKRCACLVTIYCEHRKYKRIQIFSLKFLSLFIFYFLIFFNFLLSPSYLSSLFSFSIFFPPNESIYCSRNRVCENKYLIVKCPVTFPFPVMKRWVLSLANNNLGSKSLRPLILRALFRDLVTLLIHNYKSNLVWICLFETVYFFV